MSARHTFSARVTSWGVIGLGRLVTLLPRRWAIALGGGVGWLMSWICPIRQGVMRENLIAAFPEMTPRARRRLQRRFWVSFGRWALEQFYSTRPGILAQSIFVAEEGREHRDWILSLNRGFVVATGHLGNWELMGAHFAAEGLKICVVAKPLHNGYLNDHIVRSRGRVGLHVILTGRETSQEAIERIRAGEIVTFLPDQDAREFGTFVEFLGRPASTHRGAAMCAIRAGVPMFPVFSVRERGIHHRILCGEPIMPPESPEDIDRAVQEMMQAFTRQLAAAIRRFPEQYFWLHRRWKTRPEMVRPKRRRRAGLAP